VLSERLNRYGSRIAQQARCAHEAGAIAAAVAGQLAAGCNPILIFGASAITDRRDEIPTGIEQAGGTVERFGMPVDPGNLLLLARHGDVPVIGLPGCARSPKLNGFDWVLERLLADIAVTDGDIAAMGVGGLLKEIPSRPQPRLGDQPATSGRVARIAALILAAGQSRRMGAENKLLADVGGRPMVSIAADAAAASQAVRTIVVTGHEEDSVRAVLKGDGVEFVNNPDYAEGLSTSLKAGVAAMPDDIDGVVVLLGDMPKVTSAHINALIAAFDPLEGRSICVPTHRGKRGNPVLFSRNIFAEIADVAGDVGAKYLIGQHEDEVAEVPVGDDGIFADVDTPQALASIRRAG
jgi:molybdenum cofactor cytidylyltransferase